MWYVFGDAKLFLGSKNANTNRKGCTLAVLVIRMISGMGGIWDNIRCYRFYLTDYLPWILTTLATYLLKSVASITQKSIQTFK